jgi:NAD(P)-dependent dehydrogenase (short-subunit alcohol dehydrogenase family)
MSTEITHPASRTDRRHGNELDGATVVLTGATTGIGRATAEMIANRVGFLILHGLEPEEKANDTLQSVRASMRPATRLAYSRADFTDHSEVARLAQDIGGLTDRVDILINNAARPGPASRTVNDAGIEVTLQTNYLAPVALTTELLGLVGADSVGRVVNIASATHHSANLELDDLNLARHPYSPPMAYAHSKLALVTYTGWLAANRPHPSLNVVSMHPGIVSTDLLHAMYAIDGDRPQHAAGNIQHVASLEGDNGTYYDERRVTRPNPQALNPENQTRLHDLTKQMLEQAATSTRQDQP